MSRSRLAETFNQLMLTGQTGSVLIRIHTSIHKKDDAVELAKFIKEVRNKYFSCYQLGQADSESMRYFHNSDAGRQDRDSHDPDS